MNQILIYLDSTVNISNFSPHPGGRVHVGNYDIKSRSFIIQFNEVKMFFPLTI